MNVTYLLGAGASANAIPVAQNFTRAIPNLIDLIKLSNIDNISEDQKEQILKLIARLETIFLLYGNVHSMDTVSNLKYINSDSVFREKKIIYELINLYQGAFGYETRYSNFLSNLLGNEYFKNNILNIISWNYDNLLENELDNYFSNEFKVNEYFDSVDKTEFFSFNLDKLKLNYFKPNGSAALRDGLSYSFTKNRSFYLGERTIHTKYLLDFLNKIEYGRANIKFSWEDDTVIKTINKIDQIDVLIIIGYSLPELNHKVDKLIVEKVRKHTGIIYVQDKNPQPILAKLDKMRPMREVNLVPWPYCDSFFIPYELLNYKA